MDPKNAGGNPDFPPGYPVTNVLNEYWPATTNAENSTNAWNVNNDNTTNSNHAWRVRGGMHADAYERRARDEWDWRETRER